jgi:hypothetical protein
MVRFVPAYLTIRYAAFSVSASCELERRGCGLHLLVGNEENHEKEHKLAFVECVCGGGA